MRIFPIALIFGCVSTFIVFNLAVAAIDKPAALLTDGIPVIPDEIATQTRPYLEFRTAGFRGWNAKDRSMLIVTRFGNTAQLHTVASPMAARTQISFEPEPVDGSWSPNGDVLVVTKDQGGNEFYQIYTLKEGKLTLLSDGKSRNVLNVWSKDGRWVAYSSTRRNGTDSDLYIVDPRDPSSNRLLAQVNGGGWYVSDFSPDGKSAVAIQSLSVTKSLLFLIEIQSGKMSPLGDPEKVTSYQSAKFAPDGSLWVISDEGFDFRRLGTVDLATGHFNRVSLETRWDVENFEISHDGRFIAYTLNENGVSLLKRLDPKTGLAKTVSGLPSGSIGTIKIAPWGEIGISFTSAKNAADAYSVDPKSLAVTRWTLSETGGLDAGINSEPELISVTSFDKETVSGFLYRPDPKKFPGRRALIINIHGGPEAQSRPSFQGRSNFLLNEMGIAIFYPNVRGSTGFGKRFVDLDNGPFKREDSVKDLGSFLSTLEKDAALDPNRFAVMGGSYGGYMCYAAAIAYGTRLKGANCSVAISSFVTFLEKTESYRRDLRRVEYGDEREPAQRKKLIEISPLTHVNKIKIPLLVVTGANDPRVPSFEAEQIVKAIRKQSGAVWHLLAHDEGHGFAKKVNQDYQFYVSLMFWKHTLLGETVNAQAAP